MFIGQFVWYVEYYGSLGCILINLMVGNVVGYMLGNIYFYVVGIGQIYKVVR